MLRLPHPAAQADAGQAYVNDLAPNHSAVTAGAIRRWWDAVNTGATVTERSLPWRHAGVPAPGRQLPQAKPGWWLGE